MTQRSIFILHFCLLLRVSGVLSQTDQQAELKLWNESRELHWADFRKTPPRYHKFVAQSWTGFDVFSRCVDGRFFYDVTTFFNCDSSWVKKVKGVDKLLRHEQGHFDLAEISARELRKALQYLEEPCGDLDEMKKQVGRLMTYYRMKLNTDQTEYDNDTGHGSNGKKQKKWEEKIALRLKELETYQE